MEKRLERNEANKMVAGVAAGLADYLNVEVTWIRVLFVFLTIFGFAGIWIYIILWIVMPARSDDNFYTDYPTDYRVYEDRNTTTREDFEKSPVRPGVDYKTRYITGLILIILGCIFLLNEFVDLPEWFSLSKLWPLIFIGIGLLILFRTERKKEITDLTSKNEPPSETNTNVEPKSGEQPLA